MIKPVFDADFKQRVVNNVLEHPNESKLAVAKRFCIANSTVHKWLKDVGKSIWRYIPKVVVISQVMKKKKLPD